MCRRGVGVDVYEPAQSERELILRLEREVAGVVTVEPENRIRGRLTEYVAPLEQCVTTTPNRPGLNESLAGQQQSFLKDRYATKIQIVFGGDANVPGAATVF